MPSRKDISHYHREASVDDSQSGNGYKAISKQVANFSKNGHPANSVQGQNMDV